MKILTDDAAILPEDFIREKGIEILGFPLFLNNEEVTGISPEEFFERMRKGEIPRTSLIPPSTYEKKFKEIKDNEILYIALTKTMSGTIDSAYQASKNLKEKRIHIFDSGFTANGQGLLVIIAQKLKEEGKNMEKIVEELEKIKNKIKTFFVIPDLKHLYREGRITKVKEIVGSIMKIKPIITFENGKLVPYAVVRKDSQAIEKFIMEMKKMEDKKYVLLSWSENKEIAERLKEEIERNFGKIEIYIARVNSVCASKMGNNSWGIAFV